MRLICPSCGAQYEVDESVIPDGGRDVQCSNCGHAWFQHSARQQRAAAEEAALQPAEVAAGAVAGVAEAAETVAEAELPEAAAAPEPEAESEPGPAGDDAPARAAEPDAEAAEFAAAAPADDEPGFDAGDAGDAGDDTEEAEERATPAPELRRRNLDDAVRNVLREEAEREARARGSSGAPVESQPDLGLTAAAVGAAAAARRMGDAAPDRVASVGGDDSDFDDDALVPRAARRELLPDIEEINSTLRATSERGGEPAARDAPETLARRRSGFRRGFTTALLVAVLALGLYVLAPVLAEMVPALEPALTSYVAAVDAARLWLDARMQALTQSLGDGTNG